jgi:tetratricopeptide (TPR) repeat protein
MKGLVDDPNSKRILGLFYQNLGKLSQSISAYKAALQIEPNSEAALVNISMVYAQQGNYQEAEGALSKAIEAHPESAESHFNLGLLYAETGRLELAEKELRQTLTIDENFGQAAYNLAVILAGRNDLIGAINYCRQAFRASPAQMRYGYSLAFYLRQASRTSESVQVLERILARQADHVDSAMLLGTIYEELGHLERAAAVYRRVLERPLSPEAQGQIMARVQQLEQAIQ